MGKVLGVDEKDFSGGIPRHVRPFVVKQAYIAGKIWVART